VQPIFFSSDRSTLSSTPGTRRGCPSFPSLDLCLHSHLSVLLLRQERAANSRRLRYRQTVDTCSHSIASRCGLDWTSVCIQSELTCWPVDHRGLSPHFHVISSFQCVPIYFALEHKTPISGPILPVRFGVYSHAVTFSWNCQTNIHSSFRFANLRVWVPAVDRRYQTNHIVHLYARPRSAKVSLSP